MPSHINLSDLAAQVISQARSAAIKKMVSGKRNHVTVIDGLAGSAAAVVFTALPKRSVPYLIVANDLDEAGYIYNDLCQLSSEQRVFVFPSGYTRDIKYNSWCRRSSWTTAQWCSAWAMSLMQTRPLSSCARWDSRRLTMCTSPASSR